MYIYVQQSLLRTINIFLIQVIYINSIYILISVFSSFIHKLVKNGIKGFTIR
jgi:hypothetical protein